MSTIERIADLLGPLDAGPIQPQFNRSASIERTLAGIDVDERHPEAREAAARREAQTIADELQAKAAAAIPKANGLVRIDRAHLRRQNILTPHAERSASTESFRRIKRQILKASKIRSNAPANLVLVTSALPGEGKTYCAVNLAISLALEMNRTVLLVDADVAKPSVPNALGIEGGRGLLDVLRDPGIDLSDVLCKTDIGKLTVLPAGTAHHHATELLASDEMRELLKEIAEKYHDRIVVFDSPPLLAASESSVLAAQMGQIVVVVEAGKTPEAALKSALGRIDTANVTGVVLNKGDDPGLRYHYGEYG